MKKLSLVLLLMLIVIGPIIVPNSPVKAATGGYGTVNLAKGKPVTPLTNTVRGKPGDVNDGNIDSVWYSSGSNYGGNGNANSFVVDLGRVYSIGKIDIFPAQIHGFTISTSDDNSTWTERYKSAWVTTSVVAPISVTPDGAFSARYIKYWGFANWSQYVGVLEINVYEWLASPPPPPSGANGSINLALNKTATNLLGPVIQSNPPAYAIDGNPATSWASSQSGRDDGTGKWQNNGQIKIDLGAKYRIGKVVISPQRVHDFRMVMAETDPAPAGSPWFFMSYPELFGAAKTSGDPYTFSLNGSVTARYIWLTADIWGTPGSLQPAIAEIEVYEWGTSSTPSATATPAPGGVSGCVQPPAGLVSSWPGDGNANDIQGVNNGILRGGLGFGAGKVGQGFSFTTGGQGVKVAAAASLTLRDSITIEAWVSPAQEGPIVEYNTVGEGYQGVVGTHLWLYPTSDILYANLIDTGGNFHIIRASGIVVAGEFQHVAVTYSKSSGVASLYRNGKSVQQQNLGSFAPATNGALNIGLRDAPIGGASFRGFIDEVAAYSRALSEGEILAIFWAGSAGKCKGPAAPATQPSASQNLLRNPGAEEPGPGLPGWTTTSNFGIVEYGGTFPSVSESQRIGGGNRFFSGGLNNALSTAAQIVDVSSQAADIDAGRLTAQLQAQMAGYADQGDNGTVKAEFLSASGGALGSIYVGPVGGTNNVFQLKTASGPAPAGTRSIRVTMTAVRTEGADNDAFFDNLFLGLQSGGGGAPAATPIPTPTPAPTSTPGVTRSTDTILLAEERAVSPNGKATVPIRLDKADRLGSLNFSLRYDPSVLKVNKAEAGDLAGGTLFQANIREAGIIRFGIVAQGTTGITGDGPVAHVEFTAVGARGAQSQLSLGDLMATDTSGARMGVTLRSGRVTIAAKLKGDYDGDGKVTAKDSLAALKMSVGELAEDPNLDMDSDGKVTAEDARRILTSALSGAPTPTATQPTPPSQPTQPTTTSTPPTGGQAPAALPPLVSKTLEPSSAPQLISYKDEVGVIIPGGTLESRQTASISPAPNLPARPFKGFTQLAAYDISIGNIHEFKELLTIEIAYDPAMLPPNISPDKALAVTWWDPVQKKRVNAPFAVDTTRNVIMIPTTHLTVWEVIAWSKSWSLKETEHFKIYYDPKNNFNIAGAAGTVEKLAGDVGMWLEEDYKAYEKAGYSMRLTFIPPMAVGSFVGAFLGGTAGAVGGGIAGTMAGGFWGGYLGARAGLNTGGKIGAAVGTGAAAVVVGSKTYVILDSATTTAQWNKQSTGEIYIPLRHSSYDELRHDLAHELFHAVQNSYFFVGESGMLGDYLGTNNHWWLEATADYAPVSVGLSKSDALPKVWLKYFEDPLPTEGNEREYVTSRFIEYMVKRRVDFKAMWDDVACLACKERVTTTVLQRIEGYHDQRQPNLHTLFRSWAAEVFFDANSPLELETGKTLEKSIAVSKDSTLSPTDSSVLYDVKLPADYTAQLWRITVGQKGSQTERSLKVMAAALSEQGKVTVNAFVLPNDQRVPGGVATKLIPLYSEGGQTANVTVKKNETLYIMAVNSQTKSVDLSVKVTDDADWVLKERVIDRVPKTDGSADLPGRAITLDRSVVVGGDGATVVLDWKAATAASTYKAQWTCNWMGPPPPTPTTGQWSGPGVASKQPGNFAEVLIDTPAYKSRWLCNTPATAPPVSGWTEGETWDTTVTVVNPRTGTNRNVAVESLKAIDKSRWLCNWPVPPTSMKPGQKWEGTVSIKDAGSDNPTAAWVGGRVSLKLGSNQIVLLDVQRPGQASASQKFSWDVPGSEMAVVAYCSATMQPSESGIFRDTIGDSSVTVTYKYEQRQ